GRTLSRAGKISVDKGNTIDRTIRRVIATAIVTAACLAGTAAAQTKPLQGWQPPQGEPDPAKPVPPSQPQSGQAAQPASEAPAATWRADDAGQAYYVRANARERSRSGAFIGAAVGKGWVFDSVDQSARQINVGYRWQAGPVALLGVEAAAG